MGTRSRSPHHVPPSVRFPLARSQTLLAALVILALAGLCTIVVAQSGQRSASVSTGWAWAMATTWCAATTAALMWWWRSADHDWLAWNGVEWTIFSSHSDPQLISSGSFVVAMDFQWALLVSCKSDGGDSHWLWLERAHAPANWLALRRAAYAGAAGRPHSDAVGI